ncbi:MAG TPA: hypothetical protein VM223_21895, partial [Planctomycetota bacterium]|nr:hypothetical protein [Planctomycetota bacterium]
MSGDQVTFRVAADTNDAVQAYYRLVQVQKESERAAREQSRATREADRAAREHARSVNQVAGAARSVLGAFGVSFGIAGAVSLINRGVEKWKEHMDGVARSTRAAMNELIAFSQVQEPGTLGVRARAVAKLGTEFGFTPAESLASFQAVQSQLGGDYAQAQAAFREIGALRRAGVPMEAARDAVLVGTGLGYTPGQAARAAYAAGKLSSRTPADIAAQAGVGLIPYRGIGGGMETAYAIMAQLSSVIPAGELGTYTARAGTGLTDVKFWRRFGVREPGKDPLAQLELLAGRGITTQMQLERRGMGEERERRALSVLLADLPGLRKRMADLRAMVAQPGLLGGELAEAEMQLPQLRTGRRIQQVEQQIEFERALGPEAGPASERDLMLAYRALVLQRQGKGWLVGDDKRAGGLAWWLGTGYMGGGPPPAMLAEPGTQSEPAAKVDRLIDSLDRN